MLSSCGEVALGREGPAAGCSRVRRCRLMVFRSAMCRTRRRRSSQVIRLLFGLHDSGAW
jgi:hypothetical protein